LRHTIIKDFENRRVVIPNSVIGNETIINSTLNDERVCMFVDFNISFDSDVDTAIQVAQEEALKHPLCIDGRTTDELIKGEHQVMVRTIAITDFAVQIRAYVWAKNATDGFELKCDLHKSIKRQFDKTGVEIPYPYRTILYKNEQQKKG
jgi:small conductance mechanosensitive channel